MSYTVDLIVEGLPRSDKSAWKVIERLRKQYYGDVREKAPALLALHVALTAKYRCLSSYGEDEESDESPWADGPMLGNFAHEMGMLAISFPRVDEVLPFIVDKANALGISVADVQTGKIYHPSQAVAEPPIKPWWRIW